MDREVMEESTVPKFSADYKRKRYAEPNDSRDTRRSLPKAFGVVSDFSIFIAGRDADYGVASRARPSGQ
jgi:hypothetical protein